MTEEKFLGNQKTEYIWLGGPVGSGKSGELIVYLERYELAERRCLAIKHVWDDSRELEAELNYVKFNGKDPYVWLPESPIYSLIRPFKGFIRTRRGGAYPCVTTDSLMPFISKPDIINSVDVFAFDEGQFFEDLYEAVVYLMNQGKTIITSGLDADYKTQPFKLGGKETENVHRYTDLVALATDGVFKMKAVCLKCKEFNGSFSQRVDINTNLVDVKSKYLTRCSKCFINMY